MIRALVNACLNQVKVILASEIKNLISLILVYILFYVN